MNLRNGQLRLSPTDLANFLTCHHKTALDLLVAKGLRSKPTWIDPLAEVLRERGDAHEARHVAALRAGGLEVVEVPRDIPQAEAQARTLVAMQAGADVIVQATLAHDRWFGYADVLRKVDMRSPAFGSWSYEAHDTKLTRETRGGTILQLCVYSDLLGDLQGRTPEHFRVVTPIGTEGYRFDDFAAFYRQIKTRLIEYLSANAGQSEPRTYPDPVEHCGVCRWSAACTARRRQDDHLSFVAGLGRRHQVELADRGVTTLASLAALPLPLPFKPARGAKDTYEGLREQARLQLAQRQSLRPVFELLDVEPGWGLSLLPEPRPGDLFLDLEGDPFGRPDGGFEPGEGGREYLFGLGRITVGGEFAYRGRWAFTDGDERSAFGAVMTEIMTAIETDPGIHVYHYAPYEPSAFRRLAGRYASREADLDRLLRGSRFVDLYAVVRHALRAGVERYSIKHLEPFYGFVRDIELEDAGDQRRVVEIALETADLSAITDPVRVSVEGYNKDDCRSTWALRRWLETLRTQQIAAGLDVPRPPLEPGDPTENIKTRDLRAIELRARLLEGVPIEDVARTEDQHARYLLAYLVDFHRREERVAYGEYHRLREKAAEDLLDEPEALVGLEFVCRVVEPGGRAKSVVDRYRYPLQENDLRDGDKLKLPDDEDIGEVVALDKAGRTIDIKKRIARTDAHPAVVIAIRIVNAPEQEKSIQRLAERVIAAGFDGRSADRAIQDLLFARAPRLRSGSFVPRDGESATAFAVRICDDLDSSVLAIQGPPGAGKTFTGASMIAKLAAAGFKVGVVANSHKVIRKLLVDAGKAGALALAHKGDTDGRVTDAGVDVLEISRNDVARAWLDVPGGRVLGGTAWMWAREEFASAVEVLFVDEAGQMSLANVVAVAPAANSLVLLGDPQQLDQPQRGSHPDGVDVSALDQFLAGHQTMPPDRGIFLPITWRLAPDLCAFTSAVFYEGKLSSRPGLERQRIVGSACFDGAGLFVVDVEHDGCRNASVAEAEAVRGIVAELLEGGACVVDEHEVERRLEPSDILVVAPYNAHVNLLQERVGLPADCIGTVDKFQGQEAPVVIYSMATSRPEDAPRGMEFLYSLNRLNVATSRARCICLLVGSPRLYEPECQTPRQMQLANALARAREMGRVVARLETKPQ